MFSYITRVNHSVIETSIGRSFVTALLGPRRVGKTFFLEHYAQQHPDRRWVFLNMDKMEQRRRVQQLELEQLINEEARQHIGGHKIWVVIDEAQKCPEIFDQIKILYDTYKGKDKIKFILTGSAQLSLHKLSAESLAGRIELFHLYGFTLREIGLLNDSSMPLDSLLDIIINQPDIDAISHVIHKLAPYKPLLEQQLIYQILWGGFPELYDIKTDAEKIIYLNNYLQTYLEKDVRAIESITDLNLYRNMMDVLAEQTGSLRDDQKIIQALGCTRDTLKKYRGYFEATLLYQSIYPYISSSLKRLVKSQKGYLLSNGLISVLTGITQLEILEKTGSIGHRLENWFLNEINTWAARNPARTSINYWQTSGGSEVDFVVVKKPGVFPFEVTTNAYPDKKKIRNLKTFLEDEPKASWGFYIYRGEFHIDRENKIIFIPCWAIS